MIQAVKKRNDACYVDFVWEKDPHIRGYKMGLENLFSGSYLDVMPVPLGSQTVLMAGCGKERQLTLLEVRELTAVVAKACKARRLAGCSLDVKPFVEQLGPDAVISAVLGLGLGGYEYVYQKTVREPELECDFGLEGADAYPEQMEEGLELLKGIRFARDMVNTPGNHLRPMDFERMIQK